MNILDEASQVLRLQPPARAEVARARGGDRRTARRQRAAEGARPAEGRLHLHRHATSCARRSPRSAPSPRSCSTDPQTGARASASNFLGIIIKETERLTRLINQVLDLAKIESGNAEWHTDRTGHARGDRGVGGGDQPRCISDKRVSTGPWNCTGAAARDGGPRPPDPGHAEPAVQCGEVLCRRRRARARCGWTARATTCASTCRTTVPGISPPNQKIIFEKFRQVGDTLTDKPQGTGLGLPICRQIIEHFGGRLLGGEQPRPGRDFFVHAAPEAGR